MKLKFFGIVLSLLWVQLSYAQKFNRTSYGVKASIKDQNLEVQFFGDKLVRVIKFPVGNTFVKESLSVIKKPETVVLNVKQLKNVLTLKSRSLQVNIDLTSGNISFANLDGENLFKETSTQFTAIKDLDQNSYHVKQSFGLDKDEVIYGLGQQQTAQINQRNQTVFMRQRALHASIPFIQSVKGYGMFWDNYSPTTFKDTLNVTSFDSEVGDGVDYYFMYGKTGDKVIAQMRELTGQAPMYPLWTFGFWQSRERYKSQKETVGVVEEYRRLGVPLDGIIQDWQYWGPDSNWNAMKFENPLFPNGKAMIDQTKKLNAHTMISVWASFGPKTTQFKELQAKKMLLNFETWPANAGVKPYDPYNPQARNIYWDYMNKGLFSLGIDTWWLDSTEPDHLNIKESDFDQPTYLGSFRKFRNAFPLQSNKGVYENQRATSSDKRVYLLTRSAFAGQQRYAANTWSGDVVANWDVFQKQIPTGLNFSLSGIPYWNTDIGGFFLWDFKGEVRNKAYHELYTRWFQYGTFTPMTRSHGSGVEKEIYKFGKRGTWAFDSEEKYINLRYRMLPYLYATAWNVTNNSGSFLRPLFMDFNADKKVQEISNQYLFGKSFMVAPVVKPMYVKTSGPKYDNAVEDFSKVKTQPVYLPAGIAWYDFWTGEKLNGGQIVNKEVPIDIMPIYLKAGTILPLAEKVQYATEKKWDNLELRIYAGANGEFILYEDENDNYNYEKGMRTTIKIKWNNQARTLTIDSRKGSFPGMLTNRNFNIVMVNQTNGKGVEDGGKYDKVIKYSGKAIVIKI
jgi:alpha-D-xyloside xylohydrolase